MHNFSISFPTAIVVQANFLSFCFKLSDQSYQDRWIESTFKGSDSGKFVWSAGKFYGDANLDKGQIFFCFRRCIVASNKKIIKCD